MKKSGSKSDLSEMADFGSLQDSGVDLRNYKDQLMKDRNSRTLTLRSLKRPSVSSMRFGQGQMRSIKTSQDTFGEQSTFPFLDPENIIGTFQSMDEAKIRTLMQQITECAESRPRLVMNLMKKTEIFQPIVDALNGEITPEFTIPIMGFISVIFPLCKPPEMNVFVDCDLCFSLYAFITSESEEVINAAIQLIAVLSEECSYARDAMISFGIHTTLMEIAKASQNEALTEACCNALHKIFGNPDPIDSATVMESVNPMAELLSISSVSALESVIDCFVEMTNKIPSIVFMLYDLELYPTIIGFLGNESLTGVTLRLIGNMSVAHPPQIRLMLELDLFNTLLGLLDSDYATCVFWIFSNMLESVPQLMMPLFTEEFVNSVIELVANASFDVKKEAAYFLSTLILFSEADAIPRFMTQEVTDVLVEMLGCGVVMIIVRCIDTLIRFIHISQTNEEYSSYNEIVLDSDIRDRLQDLISPETPVVNERAEYLIQQLESITPSS